MSTYRRRSDQGCRVVFRICRGSCLLHTVGGPPAVRTGGGVLATSGKDEWPCLSPLDV